MTDLSVITANEMKKILDRGENFKDPDLEPFYNAMVNDEHVKVGLANTLKEAAQKFSGAVMSEPKTQEELMGVLATVPFARPILSMMYIGAMIGAAKKEAELMEGMFNPVVEEVK